MSKPRTRLTADDMRRLIDDLNSELERAPANERDSVYAAATAILSTQEVSLEASRLANDELGVMVKRYGIRWT